MKRFAIFCVCVFLLFCVLGCPKEDEVVKPAEKAASDPIFPKFLVGTWKSVNAPDGDWTITLSPEGVLSSATIPLIDVKIKPNETTKVEMKDGSISTITAGDCPVVYDPNAKELSVVIKVDAIHIKFADEAIDGNSMDLFAGKVSEDGKFWLPDWMNIFDYGPRFPQGEENIPRGTVTFQKIGD